MATPSSPPPVAGPAEPVPVAILARTSTLALQDPYASLNRQITSAREWLPDGFYVAGYYWDVESGGLDIEQRGHGTYDQLTARGLPRDGGLSDLLAEAKAPQPRFAAVVVEDIERSARDTYNSLKLERQLADQGIPLFATDEPADFTGISPTTILVRRIKQGVAEWFRLQLKEKTWKGLKEHTTEGWNIGPVPYGYLPERVPHPNPFKAAQGRTKTRLALHPDRAPVVAQIFAWRTEDQLGVNAIVARLNADPATYPPADPAAGWSLGGVSAILGNPKYTGYQVFGRRRRGRPVPAEQWHWSPVPAHPQIIDRPTWDAAQAAGAGHGSTRDGDDPNPHPATRRTYVLRSRVRCKLCQRRMCGITRTHRDRGPHGDYAYYICQFNPDNPRHAAAVPHHPRTVAARQDLLLATLRDGLGAYALAPGRAARLAELLPAGAADAQARHDAQAAALRLRIKQIDAAEHNLITELNNAAGMPPKAADAYRARIRQQFVTLCADRETLTAQLEALDKDAGRHGNDPALLDELPELAARLDELPERLQAELFAAFDIQILWNAPMKQATFFATITDTTPGIVAALLDRAIEDPATATATASTGTDPDQAPASTGTFSVPSRSGICRKLCP